MKIHSLGACSQLFRFPSGRHTRFSRLIPALAALFLSTGVLAQPDVTFEFESMFGKRGFYDRDFNSEGLNPRPPTGFTSPTGIDFMSATAVIVADRGNLKMQHCSVENGCQWFGGDGAGGGQFSARNFATVFDLPHGVEADGQGNFVVADEDNQLLQYCDLQGCKVSGNTANTGQGCGSGLGHWCNPQDAAFDSQGRLIALDSGNNRIKVISTEDMFLKKVFMQHGTALGQVDNPRGIAIDSQDRIIISDTGNNRIQICDFDSNCTAFGSLGAGLGKFNTPIGVDVDAAGRIWVADSLNNRIQVCDYEGNCVAFGEFGDFSAQDTNESQAGGGKFNGPSDVAVHHSGRVAVVDTLNHRIQMFTTEATAAPFGINPGMNDAWLDPSTPGQGFFITVLPDIGKIFLAHFTFDTEAPASLLNVQSVQSGSADFGSDDHRWVTGLGDYAGASAVINAELSSGGTLDSADFEVIQQQDYGTYNLTFTDCMNGRIDYDFPGLELSGSMPITRAADDNASLCEALQSE